MNALLTFYMRTYNTWQDGIDAETATNGGLEAETASRLAARGCLACFAAAWQFAGKHIHGGVSNDAGQTQRRGFGKDLEDV